MASKVVVSAFYAQVPDAQNKENDPTVDEGERDECHVNALSDDSHVHGEADGGACTDGSGHGPEWELAQGPDTGPGCVVVNHRR